MDSDQDFIVHGGRRLDLFDVQDLGGAVFVADGCFHLKFFQEPVLIVVDVFGVFSFSTSLYS